MSNREMRLGMTTRSDVPVFDNTMSSYSEHWKRAVLYSMKMLDGKQKQRAVTLQISWRPTAFRTACGSFSTPGSSTTKGRSCLKCSRSKYFKSNRRPRESMFEYIQRICLSGVRCAKLNEAQKTLSGTEPVRHEPHV